MVVDGDSFDVNLIVATLGGELLGLDFQNALWPTNEEVIIARYQEPVFVDIAEGKVVHGVVGVDLHRVIDAADTMAVSHIDGIGGVPFDCRTFGHSGDKSVGEPMLVPDVFEPILLGIVAEDA